MVNLFKDGFFTQSQRKALLIIIAVLSTSAAIQWLCPHQMRQKLYDYSESDSTFNHLSVNRFNKDTTNLLISGSDSASKNTDNKKNQIRNKKDTQNLIPNSIYINSADAEQLQKLPRIGPKLAERIIEYRNINGPFKNADDLLKVKGIGKKTLENLLLYLNFE